MKTSNKILFTLFTVIVIGIIAFNIAFKAKYNKGNFDFNDVSSDIYQTYNLEKVNLKPFKYLVINGAILTKNGKEIKWNPNVQLRTSADKGHRLGIRRDLQSILEQHVSNDTLYIYFKKNRINEHNLTSLRNIPIFIEVDDLQFLNTKNLNCSLDSLVAVKPLLVETDGTSLTFNTIKVDLLRLRVGPSSYINFNGIGSSPYISPTKVKKMEYTIALGSTISVQSKDAISQITCLNPSKYIVQQHIKSLYIAAAIDYSKQNR